MKQLFSLAAVAAITLASVAHAGVGYIRGADVEKGEFEVEYEMVTSFDDEKSKDNKRSHKIEGYYGFTDSLQLGGGFKGARSAGDDTDLETFFVEGIYQFIESEEYGFDMAILGEYVFGLESGKADKVETKLLYENEWGGGFKTKANLIFEHEVGDNHSGGVEFESKLGTVYKINKYFKPGLEWQAEYGQIDDIGDFNDEQSHYVGPVVYGDLFELPNHGGEIEYQIGYLFGINDKAADGTLRFLIEYEIEF